MINSGRLRKGETCINNGNNRWREEGEIGEREAAESTRENQKVKGRKSVCQLMSMYGGDDGRR